MTRIRTWFAVLLITLALPAHAHESVPVLLNMLDYMAVDYPAVVQNGRALDAFEYTEQREFAANVRDGIAALPDRGGRAQLLQQAERLIALVERKADAAEVTAVIGALREGLLQQYPIAVAPRKAPDLARGKMLYEAHCSGCHGPEGRGNGPQAVGLEPAPTDFHDRARQFQRNVFSLYNTIGTGVAGTAMPGFSHLSEDDRWALALYVANFPFSATERAAGQAIWNEGEGRSLIPDLRALMTATPQALAAEQGDTAVQLLAYLRSEPKVLEAKAGDALARAQALLDESLAHYRAGRQQEAYRSALSAYLDGFELAESTLRSRDAELVLEIEQAMLAFRQQVQKRAPLDIVEEHAARARELLARAQEVQRGALTPAMGFTSAFIILLREGLEAILVLAAIGATLIRADRRDALPYLHAGWISAVVLGLATWGVASYVVDISGASREMTEGVTALLAAAVLVYVGFWLHDKTHAERWRQFVEHKIRNALHGKTLWALAAVAFLAVYREMFETVLFYQALWMQAGPDTQGSLIGGMVVAALCLGVVTWLILRFSVRLPLRTFFAVNAAFLFLLAVVFAGHGVAALQEAGRLPADPVPFFPRIGVLGVYPTVETLAVQAGLLLLGAGLLLYERTRNSVRESH